MVSVSLEYTGHRWGVEISCSKAGQGNLHPLGDSPTHQLVTLILHGNRINSSAPLAFCVFALKTLLNCYGSERAGSACFAVRDLRGLEPIRCVGVVDVEAA